MTTENKKELEDFLKKKSGAIAYDKEHNPVFFCRERMDAQFNEREFSINNFS
jgi:hypothetical protein